jgi:hypothetical protein
MAKATKKKLAGAKVTRKKVTAAKTTKKKLAGAKVTRKKVAAAKATKKTTGVVLQHHMQALVSGKLDEIMKDYCEQSWLCTPMGTSRGLKEIRDAFAAVLSAFPPEAIANMKNIKQEIQGDYAYILWSALPIVPFGGDTFHIRDGVIIMQTFVGQTS